MAQLILPDNPITLRDRAKLTVLLRDYPQYRDGVRERCKNDPIFFINLFGFTFDPREGAPHPDLPFLMTDNRQYQMEVIEWFTSLLDNQEDGLLEKSREMGATWLFVAWLCHNFLFRKGFQALVGSRKEDLVDNWTLDSHFGKIAYFLEHLPRWLLPKGYNPGQHRMKLKVVNPENGNVIIGESSNPNFSRQGRYTVIVMDEAAFWDDFEQAFRATTQSTPTRILISTVNGPPEQNGFAKERFSGRHRIFTLHFSRDSAKNAEWERTQRSRMTKEDAAQELDIDYHRSGRGLVYPDFVHTKQGLYPWEPRWHLFVAWDFGIHDDTALIWIARNATTGKTRIVDCYSNRDKAIDFYVPFILGSFPDDNTHDYTELDKIIIADHAHFPRAMHYGDPDVYKRSVASGTSAYHVLAGHNIIIQTNQKDNDFAERKRKTELGIRNIEGINMPNCVEFYNALSNARFPQRNPTSQSTNEKIKPIHDGTSHYRSALEYYFVNEPLFAIMERPEPERLKRAYDDIVAHRR
jgi:hypothetical protein